MTERPYHNFLRQALRGRSARVDPASLPGGEEALLRWTERNGFGFVLARALEGSSPLQPGLRAICLRYTASHLHRQRWVPHLLRAGEERGVTFCGFKGCGVAHMREVYRHPSHRPLGDLDLLVERDRLDAAVEAARSIGFAFRSPDPMVRDYERTEFYHAVLAHPEYGVLEIHSDLYRDVPAGAAERMLRASRPAVLYDQPARILAPVDLLLILCVHFATTRDLPRWIWLLEIARLARSLDEEAWRAFERETLATGSQLFVAATFRALHALWGCPPPGEGMERHLSPREKRALVEMEARIPDAPLDGDRLSVARRLSGRPVRGAQGVWSSLFCHPGAVCVEFGVRSDHPFFWWHRLRHMGQRLRRGLRALR